MPLTLEEALSLYSIPLIGALILAELAAGLIAGRRLYTVRETLTNFYLMGLAVLLNLALRGFYLWVFGVFHALRILEIENPLLYWTALVLLQDLAYYALHYVDHYCRLFWAVHVTHHSSTDFNLTVGFRSSVFQPLYRFAYYIPLAWLGFRPLDIMLVYSATQIWGIFVHSTTIGRLPAVVEYLFVTPSHHRVHHGSNARYLDRNMGMLLIVWDRLFGTFQQEQDEEPVRYGLTRNPERRGPLNIVFHEFRELGRDMATARCWRAKLGYVFRRPGWRPEQHRPLGPRAGAEPSGIDAAPATAAPTNRTLAQETS